MRYELINPSDYIEFRAETRDDALTAVALLGEGAYGARRLDVECKDDDVPIMLLSCPPGVEERIGKTMEERLPQVAEVLDSFCLPGSERSSLNDICASARKLAARIRQRLTEDQCSS